MLGVEASLPSGNPARVAVLGLGYVGCVTAASLANLGHRVVGIDREGQSDRTAADDEYLRIACGGIAHTLRPDIIGNSAGNALLSTVRLSRGNPAILAAIASPTRTSRPGDPSAAHAVDQLEGE